MNEDLLPELNHFIGEASKATYASGGGRVQTPQRSGFNELEYTAGDWYYRDSYAGFLRSWGQEVVWYKDKPYWTCLYGGGMSAECMNQAVAEETFTFLKKALSAGEKEGTFQPRGPQSFSDDQWSYRCRMEGDISKFTGSESITQDGHVVFTHVFSGGLIVDQDT